MPTVTKRVSQLKKGDDLGGTILTADPRYIGNYCGSKDRAVVTVQYANGQISSRIWGWSSSVKIKA